MTASQAAHRLTCLGEENAQGPLPVQLLALKRHLHFSTFLREELERCRTDVEREVVVSALLTTRIQMERLWREVNPQWETEA